MTRSTILGFVGLCALCACACDGAMQGNHAMRDAAPQAPQAPQAPAPEANNQPQQPATPPPIKPALTLERQSVRLLPFKVRLNKLAAVTGLDPSDAAFETLLATRYEVGDYNHAQGIRPNLTWDAAKMGIWVKGLKPLCAHPNMRQRYPNLPQDLDALILDAYGRRADAQDHQAIEDALKDQNIDEPTRYQLVCLTTLSAMEFIAQ